MGIIEQFPHLQGAEMPPRKQKKKIVSEEEKALLLNEAKFRDFQMNSFTWNDFKDAVHRVRCDHLHRQNLTSTHLKPLSNKTLTKLSSKKTIYYLHGIYQYEYYFDFFFIRGGSPRTDKLSNKKEPKKDGSAQ